MGCCGLGFSRMAASSSGSSENVYPFRCRFSIDFPGVLPLAAQQVLGQVVQGIRGWIEPKAEQVRHVVLARHFVLPRQFVFPQRGHFDGREHGLVFVQRQLLERRDGICPVVIGDGRQAKLLPQQVIQQLLGRPVAITVGGMQMQINWQRRKRERDRSWMSS